MLVQMRSSDGLLVVILPLRLSAGVVCCPPPIFKPGRREKLPQKVGWREIYPLVPSPSKYIGVMIIGFILKILYTGSFMLCLYRIFLFSVFSYWQFISFVLIDADQLTVLTQSILENILDDMRQVRVI